MRRLQLSRLRWVVAMVVITGLAIVINWLGWLHIPAASGEVLRLFSTPLTRWGQALGVRINEVAKVGDLSQQNRQLAAENAELRRQLAELIDVQAENEQLRQQLQFGQKTGLKLVGADVIGFAPDNLRGRLLINRGSREGLAVGMVAVNAEQLVGRVIGVSDHTAQVQLVSDPEFRVLVDDLQTRAPGIIKGQVGGAIVMERIPQVQSIQPGDTIVTNGQDGEFPAGLVVGKVKGVSQDAQSIFQSAQIEPLLEAVELRVLMIVIGQS